MHCFAEKLPVLTTILRVRTSYNKFVFPSHHSSEQGDNAKNRNVRSPERSIVSEIHCFERTGFNYVLVHTGVCN
jgi:hypothetical protein